MSEMGLTARTIAKAYQSLRFGHKPLIHFSMRRLNTYNNNQIYILVFSWHSNQHDYADFKQIFFEQQLTGTIFWQHFF